MCQATLTKLQSGLRALLGSDVEVAVRIVPGSVIVAAEIIYSGSDPGGADTKAVMH